MVKNALCTSSWGTETVLCKQRYHFQEWSNSVIRERSFYIGEGAWVGVSLGEGGGVNRQAENGQAKGARPTI